ncbi:hypothetical protein BGX26_012272 [Mortierella sp. AD094]|nr:hypothetical protein BGX26_012272 [Mortierella sp. AD094]
MVLLGVWFTKDLVWHMPSKYLPKLWNLDTSLNSIMVVGTIRTTAGAVLGLSLTLLSLTSLFLNTWLTNGVNILPYQEMLSEQIYNLDHAWRVYYNDTTSYGFDETGYYVFEKYVTQTSMGNIGKLLLSDYQGEKHWTPMFPPDSSNVTTTIFASDFVSFSTTPKCTQLFNPIISRDINYQNITVDNQTFTMDVPKGDFGFWGIYTDWPNGCDNDTVTAWYLYTSNATRFGTPSGKTVNGYAYAAKCTIHLGLWSTAGYISSNLPVRTVITDTKPITNSTTRYVCNYIGALIEGLYIYGNTSAEYTQLERSSPLWYWITGTGQTISTDIAQWMEIKLAEIIPATITPQTVAVSQHEVVGRQLLPVSITETKDIWIIAGAGAQFLFILAVVAIYIYRCNPAKFHSDDIGYLLSIQHESAQALAPAHRGLE